MATMCDGKREERELKFLSRLLCDGYSAHIHVSRAPRSMYIVVHKGQGNARRRLLSSLETLHLENLAATMVLLRSRPELMHSHAQRLNSAFSP